MPYVITQQPVESSHIAALGYDVERQVLAVTFKKDGHVWHYANIPYDVAERFHDSDSKGRFYATQIRGKYPAEKMTGKCPKCDALGFIGACCDDCGCADVEAEPRPFIENTDGTRTPVGTR